MDEVDEVESVDELGPVDWIVVEFPGAGSRERSRPRCRISSIASWCECSTCWC